MRGPGRRFGCALAGALLFVSIGTQAQVAPAPDAEALERFQRGIALVKQDRQEEARVIFEQLTREYPDWPEPYNNLAVIYADRGEEKRAEQALIAALRTHPSYALVYRNLNSLYAGIAERAYRRALESDVTEHRRPQLALAMPDASRAASAAPTGGDSGQHVAVAAAPVPDSPSSAVRPVPAENSDDALAPPLSEPLITAASAGVSRGDDEAVAAQDVLKTVAAWVTAWSSQDVERYLSFYGHHFQPSNGQTRERWEAVRRVRVSKPDFIDVRISDPKVRLHADDRATVQFLQRYRSNTFEGRTFKTL
ncbi:MAG: tetratricopeptide repeat protein, partial [Gammaproteobacteria bacterium]|nr:tetratricopeptide repeat protein [Gammaproteobacteria bacterium]